MYGSLIYNYLCNQCYHHWSCEFESLSWPGVLDTTLCDKTCQWLATHLWFSLGTRPQYCQIIYIFITQYNTLFSLVPIKGTLSGRIITVTSSIDWLIVGYSVYTNLPNSGRSLTTLLLVGPSKSGKKLDLSANTQIISMHRPFQNYQPSFHGR